MNKKYEEGMQTRRSVLGSEWVDKAESRKTSFDADFQQYLTENAWGSVWSRPGLTQRERSMMTVSLLTALGHYDELALHLKACRNTGTSPDDIKEVLLHCAVYAGIPAANHAFKIAKEVLFDKADNA
jgi:4-carboxymuconolactone decarboxylase